MNTAYHPVWIAIRSAQSETCQHGLRLWHVLLIGVAIWLIFKVVK